MRLLACLCFLAAAIHAADRPNVLMIAIDDQYDWISCMGGPPRAKTTYGGGMPVWEGGPIAVKAPLPEGALKSAN